ncbi:UbiX family flavin prenyltransferase [Mesorhizobium sp. 65-26]|uniref:UbiX family flavin prenyltransferase n=1 Tax=Mesorhizobium sp. 65-26 TaxID=1895781 RepID=UPI000965F29B|nr:UbiX family flavin prenyltransferase [Mesorhizobium sp. 65-26]MBN9272835.1 UbiX family flavin prenyltransferase [Mesorhizobium sp.]OJX80248.1 MAG: aromatic acid decarboxylase [Mesorhizobium sp. 65-26]
MVAAPKRVIVGVTGASGFDYAVCLLKMLREHEIETHLVVSRAAITAMAHETDMTFGQMKALADHCHDNRDIAAPIASGSFRTMGMIVAPCSAKSLAEIAMGTGGTLVARAADVVLKERRRLVVLFRETPLHLGHCHNMLRLTEMGGIVMPPVPAFYPRPKSIDEMVTYTAARTLDLFDIEVEIEGRWKDQQVGK